MAVRIRLSRCGRKNRPHFRIAVYDAQTRRYTLTLRQHGQASPGQATKLSQVIPVSMGLMASGAVPVSAAADRELACAAGSDPAAPKSVMCVAS